jgi:predicted dehydrogenase
MISRRDFIRRTTAAIAAGIAAPALLDDSDILAKAARAGERSRSISANDRINVALIGCRSMGWGDLSCFMTHPEVNCVALCDIDRNILESRVADMEKMRGNRPDMYGDYRKMLERKDIDAVVIGTPDHWHCLQMVDSCAAGKDVYVEKPIANSIAECDAMVAAAHEYGRVVQAGQQQRSGSIWRKMKEYIDSGKLGRISRVNVWANFSYAAILDPVPDTAVPDGVDFDMWLGPAPERTFNPKRFHGSWRMFWDYGGGLVTDWGVHLLDMALWGMNVKGMPKRVFAYGGNFTFPDNYAETFDTLSVIYEFPDFLIQWSNVPIQSGPYGKCYGLEFKGTNGTLVANREGWEVIPEGDKIASEKCLPDNMDRENHVSDFIDCMRTRNMNTACTIENGCFCAKYSHMANISARVGKPLTFDDDRKTFHDRAADKFIAPEYRKPWKLPKF